MPDLTPAEHIRRMRGLETEAANFHEIYREIQEYVVPWRDPVQSANAPGQKQTDRIFDSTASNVSVLAASAVHGLTMPAGTKWFNVEHPNLEQQQNVPIAQWLEDVTTLMNREFQTSNLPQESQELILDLLVYGTGCMYFEMKPPSAALPFPGLRFRTMPAGSYVAAEDADGLVDTVYRKFRLTASAIWARWGEKSGKEVLDSIKQKKFDERYNIVHGVFPRDLREVTLGNTLEIPKERRPFGGVWLVAGKAGLTVGHAHGQGGNTQAPHLLESDGLFEFPFLVPRWRKMSGETYGRGPGIDSLPDIRTLNQAVEYRLKAWALAIAPPIAASDRGVIGEIRLQPFARINTRGNPRDSINPVDIGANFNVANFQEEQLRDQVRKAFFVDQLNQHASQGLSPKSATEVSISFELMMRILGPVASRLQVELLAPLIRNTYRMLQRQGTIGEAPDEELGINGDVQVSYQGPLARAQSIQEVDAVARWLQVTLPLAQSNPEIMLWVDFKEMGRVLADAVSVPRAIMKSREQVDEQLAAQAEQAQAQQAQQDTIAQAEVLNKVAPAAVAGTQINQGF